MQLSRNFTLAEMTRSATATAYHIDNTPTPDAIDNLRALCQHVLQPLRSAMGYPIKIGSGYRSPALNRKVGGVVNSQHMTGQAVDLCIDGDRLRGQRWFDWIRQNCTFDQLIMEHNAKGSYWVHVSYRNDGKNRKQVINNLFKR